MPNLKSAKKRVKQSEKRRIINASRKTGLKTAIRKVQDSLERGDAIEDIKKLMVEAESKIARAQGKGVIHRNTAKRKISKLARRVSQVSRPSASK